MAIILESSSLVLKCDLDFGGFYGHIKREDEREHEEPQSSPK
jgi:hypothetical protein